MAIAKAAGKLRGKKPKLSVSQEKHLVALHRAGTHTTSEIAELFGVARSTFHRAIQRGVRTRPLPDDTEPSEKDDTERSCSQPQERLYVDHGLFRCERGMPGSQRGAGGLLGR